MVRAKFQVTGHKRTAYGETPTINSQIEVTMSPVYDKNIEEDQKFSKYTPSGSITLWIDNPPATDYLELGKFFYVDFTEVPKPQVSDSKAATTSSK